MIEEALHPLASTSGIVIFADGFVYPRFCLGHSGTTLYDVHETALIARFQLAVQAEFHSDSLMAHPRLHLRVHDLKASTCEGEGVVVADDTFFDMTKNGGQVQ